MSSLIPTFNIKINDYLVNYWQNSLAYWPGLNSEGEEECKVLFWMNFTKENIEICEDWKQRKNTIRILSDKNQVIFSKIKLQDFRKENNNLDGTYLRVLFSDRDN